MSDDLTALRLRISELREQLNRMGEAEEKYVQTIGLLEKDLRTKRATITKLQKELMGLLTTHKLKPEADEVFAFWKQEVAPKAREFSGDRLRHVLARLSAGYTVDDLKEAVLGAKVGAFTGPNGVTHNDLELICRSPAKVDSFRKRWEAHQRREGIAERAHTGDEKPPQALPSPAMLHQAHERLNGSQKLQARLRELKGWTPDGLQKVGAGWDGQRLWLPVYDEAGELINVLRYSPAPPEGKPKLIAARGRPRSLFPHPKRVSHRGTLFVVEGETDAIAAASIGLPAVGIPGVGWDPPEGWVGFFYGVEVVGIMLDCDEPGRTKAQEIAAALPNSRVFDLDPSRSDGYDLSDFVAAGGTKDDLWLNVVKPQLALPKAKVTRTDAQPKPQVERQSRVVDHDPIVGVLDALERHRCSWKVSGRDQWQAQCPAHEDRQASLSLRQVNGAEGPKVLLNCFANCTAREIIDALGLPWGALFGAELDRSAA